MMASSSERTGSSTSEDALVRHRRLEEVLASTYPSARRTYGDRFIPVRSPLDLEIAHCLLAEARKEEKNAATAMVSPSRAAYRARLREVLLQCRTSNAKPSLPADGIFADQFTSVSQLRRIPQSAERTMVVPDIIDSFYLNLLDWGSSNVLAIALGDTVFLWDANVGSAFKLITVGEDDGPVTSVSWAPDGGHLAVGLGSSVVLLWDANTHMARALSGAHQYGYPVGSLSWKNKDILTTGGMDGLVVNNDIRVRAHIVNTYRGHRQQVCGLKWSGSGQQLASGGDDNLVFIWDISVARATHAPTRNLWLHRFEDHTAAVKALAWSPFQRNLLASGGGNGDHCIKFWSTHTGACLNSVDTGSQVCGLLWNKKERELLSSHGLTHNQLTLWKYPSMVKMADLTGHTSRVLFMAQSPDGCTVATAAGDETLRFWNVFGTPEAAPKRAKISNPGPFASSNNAHIR